MHDAYQESRAMNYLVNNANKTNNVLAIVLWIYLQVFVILDVIIYFS